MCVKGALEIQAPSMLGPCFVTLLLRVKPTCKREGAKLRA